MNMIINENDKNKIKDIFKKKGAVIAFVTDTVWGIGCNPCDEDAVKRIYEIKKREAKKPLILLSNNLEKFTPYIKDLSDKEKNILEKYMPGALTLIVEKSDKTPDYMTSGFDTVGIRIPDNKVLDDLFDIIPNGVLATTSANFSNEKSVSSKEEVEASIGNYLDFILDDYGYKAKGAESTVLTIIDNNVKIFRQGAIQVEI